MVTETIFQLSNPATWIPSIVAGSYGIYGIFRMLRRDNRNDNKEKSIDDANIQIIHTLREEIDRLVQRVEALENDHGKCQQRNAQLHEENIRLLLQLTSLQSTSNQPSLL